LNGANEVAVLVITYNGKRHLKECFDSLLNQTFGSFDIYLVDNASSDGSSSLVREDFPIVKIIRHKRNFGFAKGYNLAVKNVSSKYVVFLNDDTKVDPRWLEELVKAISRDPKVLAAGSKIFFYNRPDIIQHAGGKLTLIGAGIDIGFGDKDRPEYNEVKCVGMVCGGSMIIRKDLFDDLGGFDDRYFAYFEDVDVCWHGWIQGYKTLYVPSSIVYHKFGGSWGSRHSYNRLYLGIKNRFANMIKNMSFKSLLFGVSLSLSLDSLKAISFLSKKQVKSVFSMMKAYFEVIHLFPEYLSVRVKLQAERKLSDKELFDLGRFLSLPGSIGEFKRLQRLEIG